MPQVCEHPFKLDGQIEIIIIWRLHFMILKNNIAFFHISCYGSTSVMQIDALDLKPTDSRTSIYRRHPINVLRCGTNGWPSKQFVKTM